MKKTERDSLWLLSLLFLVFTGFHLSYAEETREGLVLHLGFNENSGEVAHDESVHKNDGQIFGARWVDGKTGSALEFDGIDDYVICKHLPGLNPLNNTITWELWFRPQEEMYSGIETRALVSKDSRVYNGLYIDYGTKPNYIKFFATKEHCISAAIPDYSKWYHIVGTYDGEEMRLYVNGELKESREETLTLPFNEEPIRIGGGVPGYGGGRGTKGIIDEVKVYNRALSQKEVCASAGLKFENIMKKKDEEAGGAKRLNNLVLEYVNTSLRAPRKDYLDSPFKTFEIDHFRNGWLFIRGQAQGGAAYVTIDSDARDNAVLILGKKPGEAMRYVPKGKHRINIFTKGAPNISRLIVRSIPMIQISELSFAILPQERPANGYRRVPRYTWDFYKHNVLPNVNVIISDVERGNHEWEPYVREFQAMGKKWLFKTSAGIKIEILNEKGEEAFEKYHYNCYRDMIQQAPYIDGIAIDEFVTSESWAPAYPIFAQIFDRMMQEPFFRSKKFYVYGQPKPKVRTWWRPAIESIMRNGFAYMREANFRLQDSEGEGEKEKEAFIRAWAGNLIGQWDEMYPGIRENNLAWTFGMWNYHYSLDQAPALDHQVFLDMQFYHVANYPTFKGLYGVSLYVTKATTKDMIRYASALVRHYFIEGNRERFNTNPLRLSHLENPGFEDGLAGWNVRKAEPDSIKSVLVKELPFKKQNVYRLPPSESKVLVMVRSDRSPNKVSQKIKNLKPGKLYSLTVYNADLTDMGTWEMVPVTIKLENVEELPEEAVDRDMTTPHYKDGRMRSSNYHFRLFRAKGSSAVLTLSDWGSAEAPVGEVSHEVMWDHIKVQPYYDGDPTGR